MFRTEYNYSHMIYTGKQAYAKASRMFGLINRSIKHKDRDILLSLYKSLVRLHLEYCIPAWSPHYVKNKKLIERIQHRFTRMFPDLRSLPYICEDCNT